VLSVGSTARVAHFSRVAIDVADSRMSRARSAVSRWRHYAGAGLACPLDPRAQD
jgi:hypothetical protein